MSVPEPPTTYAIRIEGHLDDHWAGWLGGMDFTRTDDADQAQRHGVLAGLRDIGAVLLELHPAAGTCSGRAPSPSST